MGRDIRFVKVEEDGDASGDYFEIVSLGSGDAWPCYIRPFLIAAYRKYAKEGAEQKERVLDAILQCCPPDFKEVNNTNVSCGFFGHVARDFGVSRLISARHNIVYEGALFRGETQLLLDKAGAWPCVELLLMHHRCEITSPTIKRVSAMMQILKDYVPYSEDDLKGTPFAEHNDYNVADDRWVELTEAFEKAAKEKNVVAIVE